jgi:hypothetical protein
MYSHPFAQDTVKRHQVPKANKDTTAKPQARYLSHCLLLQLCQLRFMSHLTAQYSLMANGAVMIAATLARASDKAKEAGLDRFREKPEQVRKRAQRMPMQYPTGTAYSPDTFHERRRGHSQRWSVDPRVG